MACGAIFLKTTMIFIIFQQLYELDYEFMMYLEFSLVLMEMGSNTRLQNSATIHQCNACRFSLDHILHF